MCKYFVFRAFSIRNIRLFEDNFKILCNRQPYLYVYKNRKSPNLKMHIKKLKHCLREDDVRPPSGVRSGEMMCYLSAGECLM